MKTKIRRNSMNTRKTKFFLVLFGSLTVLTASGCAIGKNREVKKAVEAELNQLKTSEPQAIAESINARHLLPDSLDSDAVSQDIADVFTLFYEDFSFRVKKITVDDDRATARTGIVTLDSKALAKDFTAAALKQHIEHSAASTDSELSMEECYLILKDLLQTGEYKTKTETLDIDLKKKEDTWQVVHTPELDNLLTGNFLSHVTDPNLLPPSKIVEIHFDAIKNFEPEQLKNYLCLDKVLDETDSHNLEIADALAEQIGLLFDYEITDEAIKNGKAVVHASVTSADIHSIVDAYQAELEPWLKTSDALAAGSLGRYDKTREMMVSAIRNNKATASNDIEIYLINDGVNWKIQMTSEIAYAVFGDIQEAMDSIDPTAQ